MNKNGQIIIIEDDPDDQLILGEIFKRINCINPIVYFLDGETAFNYLLDDNVQPFLILSDINMPRLNGFQLRDMINENQTLRYKCIPYLFFSTADTQNFVFDAYAKSVQGFFLKPSNMNELERIMRIIIDYWKNSIVPDMIYMRKNDKWN